MMNSYLYKPKDFAWLFENSNFYLKYENKVLDDIYNKRSYLLPEEYKYDRNKFEKDIYDIIYKNDKDISLEIGGVNSDLDDIGSSFCVKYDEEDEDSIECFFYCTFLKLFYDPNFKLKKIKLRSLLEKFNYKKRTSKIVEKINNLLKELGMEIYVKNRQNFYISSINLDDFIIIKLKKGYCL